MRRTARWLPAAGVAVALAGCGVSTAPVTTTSRHVTYRLSIDGSAISGPYIGNYLTGGANGYGLTGLTPAHPDANEQAIAGLLLAAGAKIDETQAKCMAVPKQNSLVYSCEIVGPGNRESIVTARLIPKAGAG